MEQQNIQLKHALVYGAAIGAIIAIYQLLLYFFGLFNSEALGYLVHVLMIVGLFITIRNFRDKVFTGTLTYGKAFGLGLLTSVFAGIVIAIFTYILYKSDPGMLEEMIILNQERLMDRGIPDDQIEMQSSLFEQFLSPGVLAFATVFSFAFWGAIFSLVLSAILRRRENPLADNKS